MRTNARTEFLTHVGDRIVVAARMAPTDYGIESDHIELYEKVYLKFGLYLPGVEGQTEYEEFLSKLEFLYDNGYGFQYMDGVIWYEDGSWSDRDEYDGAEWWVHRERPRIPDECLKEL
jgi:hypothetical protein